ncbi:hypothetical protein [Methylobacterium sp. A54F]
MSAGLAAGTCEQAERRDQAELELALMRAFWKTLGHRPMPPMAALEAAARTIGLIYDQIARAHEGPAGCRCGWEPDRESDLIVLEAQLAAALLRPPHRTLAEMPAAGRA